jgi:hypothetical protein
MDSDNVHILQFDEQECSRLQGWQKSAQIAIGQSILKNPLGNFNPGPRILHHTSLVQF